MRKNGWKKFLSMALAGSLAVIGMQMPQTNALVSHAEADAGEEEEVDEKYQMRGLTAFQIVNDMGAGWNLGNTFDSTSMYTSDDTYSWVNIRTTKAMIDAIAEEGFTTLRIPVTWDCHYSDSSTYTISSDYLDRIEEVVNYGLDNDMYVIINVHHNSEEKAVSTDASTQTATKAELEAVWTQVANHFSDYGDHLIFETINEPRYEEDWTGSNELYAVVNDYNETARAAIRATGGKNADRLIMMPTYCASPDASKASAWTNESGDPMVAVSIHAYLPYAFAFSMEESEYTDAGYSELENLFDRLYKTFISKGIPVVIGEFGSRNQFTTKGTSDNAEDRVACAEDYIALANQFAEQSIPCVWWDNDIFETDGENFGLFNRATCTFTYNGVDYQPIADAIVNGYDEDPMYEDTYTPRSGKTYFSGTGSCSGWGQAMSTTDMTIINNLREGDSVKVDFSYTGTVAHGSPISLIVQTSTTGYEWVMIKPSTIEDGVATFTYDDIHSAVSDESWDTAYKVYVGDYDVSLTVTKVYTELNDSCETHVHKFEGDAVVTLAPTAYTDGRVEVGCTEEGCEESRIYVLSADLKGYSADLSAMIDLNWLVSVSEIAERMDSEMVFTYNPGTAQERTETIDLAELDTVTDDDDEEIYVFTSSAPAKEAADDIQAQLFCGGYKMIDQTYSIAEYEQYIIDHQDEDEEYEEAADLSQALLNYETMAQKYFKYHTDNLADPDASVETRTADDEFFIEFKDWGFLDKNDDYDPVDDLTFTTANGGTVSYAGASLVLLSQTTLRFYFRVKDADGKIVSADQLKNYVTFAPLDDSTYTLSSPVQKGNYYYVDLQGIYPMNLTNYQELVVSIVGGSDYVLEYSPYTYCYQALSSDSASITDDFRTLLSALVDLGERFTNAYED